MVIVDVLPKRDVICVAVVDKKAGEVIHEIQIDVGAMTARSIRFGNGHCLPKNSQNIGHFVNSVLCLVSLKAAAALGMPRLDVNWKQAMPLARDLNYAFEFHAEMDCLVEGMHLSELINPGGTTLEVLPGTTAQSVLLGENTNWITDANPVFLA